VLVTRLNIFRDIFYEKQKYVRPRKEYGTLGPGEEKWNRNHLGEPNLKARRFGSAPLRFKGYS